MIVERPASSREFVRKYDSVSPGLNRVQIESTLPKADVLVSHTVKERIQFAWIAKYPFQDYCQEIYDKAGRFRRVQFPIIALEELQRAACDTTKRDLKQAPHLGITVLDDFLVILTLRKIEDAEKLDFSKVLILKRAQDIDVVFGDNVPVQIDPLDTPLPQKELLSLTTRIYREKSHPQEVSKAIWEFLDIPEL